MPSEHRNMLGPHGTSVAVVLSAATPVLLLLLAVVVEVAEALQAKTSRTRAACLAACQAIPEAKRTAGLEAQQAGPGLRPRPRPCGNPSRGDGEPRGHIFTRARRAGS